MSIAVPRRLLPGVFLEAAEDEIAVSRIEFEPGAASTEIMRSDERRPRAEERIQDEIARIGRCFDVVSREPDREDRRML